MRAIEHRVGGQGLHPLHALPHHVHGALEHPPAAEREDRVADKGGLLGGDVIGDMAERMAGHVDHLGGEIAERDRVAAADLAVETGDLFRLALRAGDLRAGGGLDLQVAPGMVGMPVGVPDLCDGPAQGFGLGEVFVRIGGIHGRRLAAGRIVGEIAVIVAETGKLVNLQHYIPPYRAVTAIS